MPHCCLYICCPCLLCCPKSNKDDPSYNTDYTNLGDDGGKTDIAVVSATELANMEPQDRQDYEDLQHLARKREIKITIRKGTQAGVAAGLSVMAGTIVAGPVGAAIGGVVGTTMAVGMSKNVVSLNKLLEQTPPDKRHEVIKAFNESFKEEFMDTIQNSPELKLLLTGHSPIGVVRYMVDRELIKNDKLEKLDGILKKVV